jgi:hypothetical protein
MPEARRSSPVLDDDPFYVGYLPLPGTHRRFLRVVIPTLLWSLVAIGFAIVWPQRSPGAGVWGTGQPIERTGLLIASPYPMLISFERPSDATAPSAAPTPEAALASAKVTLLTEMGKRGAGERAAGSDGMFVTIRGFRLHRDGREILELVPDSDAIAPWTDQSGASALAAGARGLLTPSRLGTPGSITRRGEILDSKCYLGAMKPGDGKQHKACAMLCIRGGIAPLLYPTEAPSPAGTSMRRYALVLSNSGGPLDEDTLALVGEQIDLLGIPGRIGDLDILFVESGATRAR